MIARVSVVLNRSVVDSDLRLTTCAVVILRVKGCYYM